MILSLFKYGDIIYSGTSCNNLRKIDRLFYRGLCICIGSQHNYRELELCTECKQVEATTRKRAMVRGQDGP